jgi:hypothetical protein
MFIKVTCCSGNGIKQASLIICLVIIVDVRLGTTKQYGSIFREQGYEFCTSQFFMYTVFCTRTGASKIRRKSLKGSINEALQFCGMVRFIVESTTEL